MQFGEDPNFLTAGEIIYAENQHIYLKSYLKEERHKILKVTISILTVASPVSDKTVLLQVTDEEDPFILFSLFINEADFQVLKEEQGLLIEYEKFPQQLVKLLQLCANESNNYHLILEEMTESVAKPKSVMKVIETNHFRQLNHLSLIIQGGSDTEVKKHMAIQLKALKDALAYLETKNLKAEAEIENLGTKLENKEKEVEALKEKCREEQTAYHQQMRMEMNKERENLLKAQDDLRKLLEQERSRLHNIISDNKKTSDSLISGLQFENKGLFEQLYEFEMQVRDMKEKIDILTKENAGFRHDVSSLRTVNHKIDADYHDKSEAFNNIRTRLAVIEQELKDKNDLIVHQQESLRVSEEQRTLLDGLIREKDSCINGKNAAIKSITDDINKANLIIRKLQITSRDSNTKLSLRTKIILEQESVIQEKDSTIMDMRKTIDDLSKRVDYLENREKELMDSLRTESETVRAKDTQLNSNATLINC